MNLRLNNVCISDLPSDQIPWTFTFVSALEERWKQIRELTVLDDLEIGVPQEYWHDHKRVEQWIEARKEERKRKQEEARG